MLLTLTLEVGAAVRIALEGGSAQQSVVPILGGSVTGERIRAHVQGGSDWIRIGTAGDVHLDARLLLLTDDGEPIAMSYRGVRHGPAEVMARLARGEDVDPKEYYFRSTPMFQTASDKYTWLNRLVSVGFGTRRPDFVCYRVFEIL